MRSVVPGQRASTSGTTPSSASKLPRPPWKGRLASCTSRTPSMDSSSPKPSRRIKSILSPVSSVPFVVTEKRKGLPSALTRLTSGSMSPSHISSGSPPKKFIAGTSPDLSALRLRNSTASQAVSGDILSAPWRTKQ